MPTITDRLKELGIDLPPAPESLANYVPAVRSGNLVTTAGQVSRNVGSEWKGKLGADLDVEQATEATRASAINCLAALLTVIDSLDQVTQVVAVHGLVNSTPENGDQATAMNGASDLMVEVFGEAGRHARTAVGVAVPFNFASSVYIVVAVSP